MIKRNSLMRCLISGLFIGSISQYAGAEEWTDFTWTNTETTVYMNASTFPKTLGNITSPASPTASLKATGRPTEAMKDSVRIWWVNFNPELAIRGFTLQVNINNSGWIEGNAAKDVCVWVDGDCKLFPGPTVQYVDYPTVPISVRLLRNSTAPYDPIPQGTNIASITMRHYTGLVPTGITMGNLHYVFNGDIVPLVPTCDVKTYDSTVKLPEVRRSDLMRSLWRYQGAHKEFSINIDCINNVSKANITFNGDKMPDVASNDVLKNMNSGKENVGVQIMFDDTPLEIGKEVLVKWWPSENTNLKFKAYYFTKNGSIYPGTVRAKSEFVITYE